MIYEQIKNDEEHTKALSRIDALWGSKPGTPEFKELDSLVDLIEAYEDEHYPMDKPEPVEVIKFIMDQQDLTKNDLVPFIGSIDKVNGVLNKQIPLNPSMIQALHTGLEIPLDMLKHEPENIAPDNILNIERENTYSTYKTPAFANA
jgi:HTH-type transcriptional regulator / antitoxin HigA